MYSKIIKHFWNQIHVYVGLQSISSHWYTTAVTCQIWTLYLSMPNFLFSYQNNQSIKKLELVTNVRFVFLFFDQLINQTPRIITERNSISKWSGFIYKNTFENVVCKKLAILSQSIKSMREVASSLMNNSISPLQCVEFLHYVTCKGKRFKQNRSLSCHQDSLVPSAGGSLPMAVYGVFLIALRALLMLLTSYCRDPCKTIFVPITVLALICLFCMELRLEWPKWW